MIIIYQNVVYLYRNKTKGNKNRSKTNKMTNPVRFTKMHGAGNDYIYVNTDRKSVV